MDSIEPYINTIIALLGIGYPILLDVISRIDERYSSEHVTQIFKSEPAWRFFVYSLIVSLLCIVVWSLKFESIDLHTKSQWFSSQLSTLASFATLFFNLDSANFYLQCQFVVDHSAKILVAFSAISTVCFFFKFVQKVYKYLTPDDLVKYLLQLYTKTRNKDLFFEGLSDLLFYSIKKEQFDLAERLGDFLYLEFVEVRNKCSSSHFVLYPSHYYALIQRSYTEAFNQQERLNYYLEQRIDNTWLLGQMNSKPISARTYQVMWANLKKAVELGRDQMILSHWQFSHQYFRIDLDPVDPDYGTGYPDEPLNISAIQFRDRERSEFLKFHMVLSSLVLYSRRYDCLKRIFEFTQTQPPAYVLLPDNMQEIYPVYSKVNDRHSEQFDFLEFQFPFPGVSGVVASERIANAVSSYLALLFIRQFTLQPYFITQNFLGRPNDPSDKNEFQRWIDRCDYFKQLVVAHLTNNSLMEALGFREFHGLDLLEAQNSRPYNLLLSFEGIWKQSLANWQPNN